MIFGTLEMTQIFWESKNTTNLKQIRQNWKNVSHLPQKSKGGVLLYITFDIELL